MLQATFIYIIILASLCTDFCDYPDMDGCPPGGSTCMQSGPSYECTFKDFSAPDTFIVKFTDHCVEKEKHMFVNSCLSDEAIGGICFAISFIMMYASVSDFFPVYCILDYITLNWGKKERQFSRSFLRCNKKY